MKEEANVGEQLDECPNCGMTTIQPAGAGYVIGSGSPQADQERQHRRECPNCGKVLRLVEGAWNVSPNEQAEGGR